MNKYLYDDELTLQLTLEKAAEDEVVETFLEYLDKKGYNFYVLKGIRSLLGMER